MSQFTAYKCDQCERTRGEGNHWVLAQETTTGLGFYPWTEDFAGNSSVVHLCSQSCAMSLLDAWMTKQRSAETVSA